MEHQESKSIPIQHKLQSFPETREPLWNDMNSWVEQRRKEWDDEMAQLKSEFFSMKLDKVGTPRKSSDSSLQLMNIGSKVYDTGRGNRLFNVSFDVSQFSPDEVDVRTDGQTLTVHAKHEEKRENKSVSREFNRKVDIPTDINPDSLRCFLKDDGMLQVEAELPSPSCESSSVLTDSSLTTDNTPPDSIFGDKTFSSPQRTDRDIYSPPRIFSPPAADWSNYSPARTERNVYGPRETDWNVDYNSKNTPGNIYSNREGDRDYYGPRKSDRDIVYSSNITVRGAYSPREVYSPTPVNRDVYSPTRMDPDKMIRYSLTDVGSPTRLDSYVDRTPRMEDFIYSPSKFDRDVYNPARTEKIFENGPEFDESFNNSQLRTYSNGTAVRNVTTRQDQLTNWNSVAENVALHQPEVFKVVVDIGTEFQPHELEVKTVDRKLVVHARHIENHFGRVNNRDMSREFDLPDGVEPSCLTANFTTDGTLIIEAPTSHLF